MPKSVSTIPAGTPFLTTLVEGVMDMAGGHMEELPNMRIFLPTRRACRDAQIAFLRAFDGQPVLLPRLQPLGDIDEDDLAMQLSGFTDDLSREELQIPPAMSTLQRTLILARLVRKKDPDLSADMAVGLAGELGNLMDRIHTEGLDFADLPKLVDNEKLAKHWQITLDFLTILSERWPEILAEQGRIDAADRRNRLMNVLSKWYKTARPDEITIAAGTSGSIPATANLLNVIAGLPNGHVVLPGLDKHLDDESWDVIGPSHPQYTLKQLIDRLEISRKDVTLWGRARDQGPRHMLATEMMRPAETLDRWADLSLSGSAHDALAGSLSRIRLLTCDTPEQEAQAIALAFRETLEEDGKTAALVTPDRNLARRVSAACMRWGIVVDDSAGLPLAREKAGSWLSLTAKACHTGLRPLALLSMLKHPLASCGLPQEDFRPRVRRLEKQALRGPVPPGGIEGMRAICKDHADILDLLDRIDHRTKKYRGLLEKNERLDFAIYLNVHIELAEDLAGGPDHVWINEDGEAAALLLAEINESAHLLGLVTGEEYLAILRRLMDHKDVRPAFGAHPRLSILGQMEARLIDADMIIMGGLNEGTWPPEAEKDPWMSRPMRREFGLPSPDETIGKAAHDYAQLFCRDNVILTRAAKVDGTPTVPARWLQRLDAVIGSLNARVPEDRHLSLATGPYLSWTRQLDMADRLRAVPQPAPTPPVKARPRKMGVTSIEKWMRDPYHIYAQKILNLNKLDPIEKDQEARDLGEWVHDVLEEFVTRHPGDLPGDAAAILADIGREKLGVKINDPRITGFWWPKFEKIVEWYIATEGEWRQTARPLPALLESEGAMDIESEAGPFRLTAKADRIDLKNDGTLAIIDYKTGQAPSKKLVAAGISPQLSLEAVIAEHNGFDGVSNKQVSTLAYWKMSGTRTGNAEQRFDDVSDMTAGALEGVQSLIHAYDDPNTPYASLPRAHLAPPVAHQDYALLARVKEWSATGDEDSE